MRALRMMVAGLAVLLWDGSSGVTPALARAPAAPQASAMQSFKSVAQLRHFLARKANMSSRSVAPPPPPPPPPAPPPPPPPPPSQAASSESVADIVTTGAKAVAPSITNTQEADVDEGGIVKVHGKHLVILRRGRLFTVALDDHAMRPIDRIDAFPPGTSGQGAWYDEMLVAGDRIIVIGFSYARGGTEINRFRIDDQGRLRYEDTYHLRSNDYYSSTNYASRLIGNKLIFYTPLEFGDPEDLSDQLPALRRWTGDAKAKFVPIAAPTRIYVPTPVRRDPDAAVDTLHTVTICDLATALLSCTATGVLGSESRDFYVSGNAVYVWIAEALGGDRASRALLYRLPLDGGRPGAVQGWGSPVDQFSFREDRTRHALDVVVRAEGEGERMWRAEVSEGDAALLHVPLGLFGDGSAIASARMYRALPLNRKPNWSFHNRFVGSYLIYSAGEFAAETGIKTVFTVPLNGGPITQLRAPHGVDRIEVMGDDAVAVGGDAQQQLGFTAIELRPAGARLGDSYFLPAAREGERRSQAYFYRPDPDSVDGASGTLGLPVTRDLAESKVSRFLGSGSAVAFLRRNNRRFAPAGELEAHAADARDDGCQASCVDWYGNARPIFLGDRIFALMGYELVEGHLRNGRIGEVGRVGFAPPAITAR